MATTVQKVKLAFEADTHQVQKELDNLQDQLKAIGQINTKKLGLDRDFADAAKQAKSLQSALQNALNFDTGRLDFSTFSKSLRLANTDLSSVISSLDRLGSVGQNAISSLTSTLAAAEIPLKKTSNMFTAFGNTLKNTVKWELSSNIVHGLESAFSNAISYAENLNKTLVSIRQVSGASMSDMVAFTKQANIAAKELAVSTKAYADASLIYYQQGDSAELAAKKAQITLKATNAAFTATASEMSEMLTATWNAYQVGSDQLEHYVDVMAKLGATTATSVEEIATSLQKVAATANTVGVGIEQMSSMIATVSSVTRQSAETIGTSMNTILSRIGGLKLGETLEDGVNLNKYSAALKSVGVNVLDTSGQLREMGDVIDELGAKWQTLSKGQQSALAQTIGGTRQYTNLMALFENWDKYQMNLANAQNSNGALQQMQNIYAEGWEGAQKRVKAAMEGIYNDIIDSDFMTDMTSTFATLIEQVNSLIKGFGGLPGILQQVSMLMTNAFGDKIQSSISNLVQNVGNIAVNFKNGFNIKDLFMGRMPSAEQNKLSKDLQLMASIADASSRKSGKAGETTLSAIYGDRAKLLRESANLQIGKDADGKVLKRLTTTELNQRIAINQQRLTHLSNAETAAQAAFEARNGGGNWGDLSLDEWYKDLEQAYTTTTTSSLVGPGGKPYSSSSSSVKVNELKEAQTNITNEIVSNSLNDAISSLNATMQEAGEGPAASNQVMQDIQKFVATGSGHTGESLGLKGSQLEAYNYLMGLDTQNGIQTVLKHDRGKIDDAVRILSENDLFRTKADEFRTNWQSNKSYQKLSNEERAAFSDRIKNLATEERRAEIERLFASFKEEPEISGLEKVSQKIGQYGQKMLVGLQSAGLGFSNLQTAIDAFKSDDATQKVGAVLNSVSGLAQAMQGGLVGVISWGLGTVAGLITNYLKSQEQLRIEAAQTKTATMDQRNDAVTQKTNTLDSASKSFISLNKQFDEGTISQQNYQSGLMAVAESLGIQGAAVYNLTNNYKALEQAVKDALAAQLEQAENGAREALNVERAGFESRWIAEGEKSPLTVKHDELNGYYILDVLDQMGQNFTDLDKDLQALKELGLIDEGYSLPTHRGQRGEYTYRTQTDFLAALLGGKALGTGQSTDDDLVVGKNADEVEAMYQRIQKLQTVAQEEAGSDIGEKIQNALNSEGMQRLIAYLNAALGDVIQLRNDQWTSSANSTLLNKTVDIDQYDIYAREALIEEVLSGFDIPENNEDVAAAARKLAENTVDTFVSGINATGATKTAELTKQAQNYAQAQKKATQFNVQSLPEKQSDVWKYTSSALLAGDINPNQLDALGRQSALLSALSIVSANQNMVPGAGFDLLANLQNMYGTAETLGFTMPVAFENLDTLSTEAKADLYNKLIAWFNEILGDESQIDKIQSDLAELEEKRSGKIATLNQDTASQLSGIKSIEGMTTVEDIYAQYLKDMADDATKGQWNEDNKKIITDAYEQLQDLNDLQLENIPKLEPKSFEQIANMIDWIKGVDLDPTKWSQDERDANAQELAKRGYTVPQLLDMTDLERSQAKVQMLREELDALTNSADADATQIAILTSEINSMQSDVNEKAISQMEASIAEEMDHWKEVESAANSALSLITNKMSNLQDLNFSEFEQLRQSLMAAGLEGEKVADILNRIREIGSGDSKDAKNRWEELYLVTNLALQEMTAVQAQHRGVENLASEGVMKEIDASKAVVSPSPIPVKGEADDVSIKEGTRPDETVGVDSEIDTASVTSNTKTEGMPKVDSEINTASVTDETKTEGTPKVDGEIDAAKITPDAQIDGTAQLKNSNVAIENFTADMINAALNASDNQLTVNSVEGNTAVENFKTTLSDNLVAYVSQIVAENPQVVDANGEIAHIPVEAFLNNILPPETDENKDILASVRQYIQDNYSENGISIPTKLDNPNNTDEVKTNLEDLLEILVKYNTDELENIDFSKYTETEQKIIELILDSRKFDQQLARMNLAENKDNLDLAAAFFDILGYNSTSDNYNNLNAQHKKFFDPKTVLGMQTGAVNGLTMTGIDYLFNQLKTLTDKNNMNAQLEYIGNDAENLEGIRDRVITAIKKDFAENDGEFSEVGRNLLLGIASGLLTEKDKLDWASLIGGMGTDLYAAICAEFQIRSPSHLTAQAGPWIIAGLDQGIQEAVDAWDPTKSLSGIGKKLMASFKDAVNTKELTKLMKDSYLKSFNDYTDQNIMDELKNEYLISHNGKRNGEVRNVGDTALSPKLLIKAKQYAEENYSAKEREKLINEYWALNKGKRIRGEIRDVEELPHSGSLEGALKYALNNSREAKATQSALDAGNKYNTKEFQEFLSTQGWNQDNRFSPYEKIVLSDAYQEALKTTDKNLVSNGKIQDFEKFAKKMQEIIDKDYTDYANKLSTIWAGLTDAWTQMLAAGFSDTDVQKEYYDSWVATFNAIAKARKGLLDGQSIMDTMMDDPESLTRILAQFQERGILPGAELMSMLQDRNFDINSLSFGNYELGMAFRGDNRWFNEKDGYIDINTTYEEYKANRTKEFEQYLKDNSADIGGIFSKLLNENGTDVLNLIQSALDGTEGFDKFFNIDDTGTYGLAENFDASQFLGKLFRSQTTMDQLAQIVAGGYTNEEDVRKNALSGAAEQMAEMYKSQTAALREYLDMIDLSMDELEDYAAQQAKLGTITGDTRIELLKNAAALYRQTKGFDTAEKNLKSYLKELNKFDEGTNEWTAQAEKIRDMYADLFDLDPDEANQLSNAFLKSTENAKLLEKAMKGDEKAWDNLTAAAAKDIISEAKMNVSVSDQQALSQVESLIPEIQSYLDANKLEVGADLNSAPFMAKLSNLTFASEAAAQAMTAALSAIGVEAEVTPETYTVPGHTETSTQEGTWNIGPIPIPIHNTITTTVADHEETIFKITGAKYNGRGVTNGGASHKTANTGGGGGGGGGGGSKIKHKEYKGDEEIEHYHQINRQIEHQERLLKKVNLLKNQRYGLGYLSALRKENAELLKSIELTRRRAGPEHAGYWLDFYKNILEENGGTFGEITGNLRYQSYMFGRLDDYNRHVDEYNARADAINAGLSSETQEQLDEWFNDYEKGWQKTIDAIDGYEEALDIILDAEVDVMEKLNQISANLKEISTYKMEFRMELNEADMKRIDFLIKRYGDYLDLQDESFEQMEKNANFLMENLSYVEESFEELYGYYHTKLQVFDKEADYIDSLHDVDDLLADDMRLLNDADYVDGLFTTREALMENVEQLWELRKQMLEVYGNTIDLAADKLSKFTDTLEHHINVYDSYLEILELTQDGIHFDEDIQILQGAYNSALTEVNILREHLDALLGQRETLLKQMENPIYANNEKIQKDFEALQTRIEEIEEQLLETTQTTLDKAKTMFDKTLEYAQYKMRKLGDSFSTDLDWLSTQWDFWIAEQDQYVDRITQVYEIDKLVRDIENAIADTRNKSNQAELKALEDEIQLRSENNALTEYDIEMMRLSYELLLAKQNLENAQDAKDTVRLTRDDNGNYIYQYTADEDKVAEAQQKYNDVLYEMNQTTKERYRELVQNGIDIQREFIDQYTQIMEDMTLSTQEKEQRVQELFEHYGNLLEGIDIQMDNVLRNMGENQLAWTNEMGINLMDTADTTAENISNLTGNTRTQLNLLFNDARTDAETWKTAILEIINEVSKSWSNYCSQLTTVQDTSRTTLDDMIKQIVEYGKQANVAQDQASILTKTMDDTLTTLAKMNAEWLVMDTRMQSVIDSMLKMDEKMSEEQREVAGKEYDDYVMPLEDSEPAQYYNYEPEPVAAPAGGGSTCQTSCGTGCTGSCWKANASGGTTYWVQTGTQGATVSTTAPTGQNTTGNSTSAWVQMTESQVQQLQENQNASWKVGFTTSALAAQFCQNQCGSGCESGCLGGCDNSCKNGCKETCTGGCDNSCGSAGANANNTHGVQVNHIYATGGLNDTTGWAWIDGTPDRPEYVLNAEQTHEMFGILNDHTISNLLNTMTMATQAMLAGLGLTAGNISTSSLTNTANAQNNTYITAEFPNATDHNEIELALENLMNSTAQSVNSLLS